MRATSISLGILWKGDQCDRCWPAWTRQASQMPFPTPAPLAAFSISSSERLDAGRCKRPGSVTVQPQYSAMLLQSRTKVDGRGFGGGFWREGFLLAWETGLLPVNESPEKSASETLQQVCVSLQRMWPAHPTALSGETTARAIQMFPR